ncbi:MAG: hypothetical protein LBG90_05195 [Spirochaetaceae bacterium]|jgi:hypothetical protein|nr:hypothetical protein [Spirochaetaceae bacterium]
MKQKICSVFDSLRDLVLEKNRRYGNAALKPMQIFSKAEADEGIKIRIDDKINRIIYSDTIRRNDLADLIGYLALYCVAQDWTDFSDLLD